MIYYRLALDKDIMQSLMLNKSEKTTYLIKGKVILITQIIIKFDKV